MLDEFYRKLPNAQTDLTRFFNTEPLKTLSNLPGDVRIEFDRYDGYTPELIPTRSACAMSRSTIARDNRVNCPFAFSWNGKWIPASATITGGPSE